MNLCIDCVHMRKGTYPIFLCAHPEALSLVDGKPDLHCRDARIEKTYCGTEGKWFEARSAEAIALEQSTIEYLAALDGRGNQ